jgi:hypothetical protein
MAKQPGYRLVFFKLCPRLELRTPAGYITEVIM